MIRHDIWLTEECKFHIQECKNFVCPIDVVKAKVVQDVALESGK